ncbi:MAG: FkbM family methyltransferase [Candidatus Zambryskibacteria bacterium]|nr:FkbM family methyltransferase [Candidatus Zambryskibacteria bacterium]
MRKFFQRLALKMGYEVKKLSLPEYDQTNPFYVQQYLLRDVNTPVIFDVGAANGETVVRYEKIFVQSEIYCFEPFKEFFENLKNNHKNVRAYNTALGNKNGKVNFHVNPSLGSSSILPTDKRGPDNWWAGVLETKEIIEIPIMTLDKFTRDNSIDHIDILKLDTQGTEYEIIEGATETLKKTKLIFTEITVIPTYEGQKEIDEIIKILRLNGFYIHNFYDIWLGKGKNRGRIRQLDAIFLNEKFFPK